MTSHFKLAATGALLVVSAVASPVLAADPLNPCAAAATESGACVLDFKGSTTLRPISDRARFSLGLNSSARALGSTTGVRALIEGECARRGVAVMACDINGDGLLDEGTDFGQSSRPINAGEKAKALANGIFVVETVIAKDGLAIVVNPGVAAGNPAFNLNQDEINKIFTNAAVTDWTLAFGVPGGTIRPVSRTSEGGTYGSFLDLYICSAPGQTCPTNPATNVRAPASPAFRNAGPAAVTFVGSNDEIVEFVRTTPGAIGYVGIAFLEATIKNLPVRKTVADPAIAATFDSVQSGKFAFSRNLYVYTVGTPEQGSCRGQYLDYLMSRQGQANVYETGYVPVYGIGGFDGGNTTNSAPIAQTLLEPIAERILANDHGRVEEKLSIIAAADLVLASLPSDTDALTDKAESLTSLAEMVEQDTVLIENLVNRASTCAVNCGRHCGQAVRYAGLAAQAMTAAADAALAGDYHHFLHELEIARSNADKALKFSSR